MRNGIFERHANRNFVAVFDRKQSKQASISQ
jgi:hypothetical protein